MVSAYPAHGKRYQFDAGGAGRSPAISPNSWLCSDQYAVSTAPWFQEEPRLLDPTGLGHQLGAGAKEDRDEVSSGITFQSLTILSTPVLLEE